MAISDKTNFWQLRTNGEDPSIAPQNELLTWDKTGVGGSSIDDNWVVTDQRMTNTPSSTAYTLWAMLQYNTTPSSDEVLMELQNGSKKVTIKADGATGLKMVGDSTSILNGLDLVNEPTMLRLTLDSSGVAKLYLFEIIEDDDATQSYISVVGASTSTKEIAWGNNSGSIQWMNVYATHDGAYSPDEMSPTPFVNDVLLRNGLKFVEVLQNSKRPYLKSFVDNSSIRYGYDISTSMISRIAAPSIHVLVKNVNAPEIDTLGGHRLMQDSRVEVFILTRGTNYKSAYRRCLDITADVFDEIMTNLGLDFNNDAILSYTVTLDTKMDDDESVCVHQLAFDVVRRTHLQRR